MLLKSIFKKKTTVICKKNKQIGFEKKNIRPVKKKIKTVNFFLLKNICKKKK